MSDTVLKRFGRYILLDRVAQGGMAEIYRARIADAAGGGRILVIKRIQSNYRSNAEFLEMFKAEIKLTMGFSHPNIVQLYDYGDADGTPYIAMEYVDGKTVRQFAGRFFKRKEMLPIDLVLSIVEQSARGLAYAHSYRDKMTGEELQIVHRDISPQNIIISYDGVVKLIDFGIAKARTSANLTRTGIIKGKPSYMAPEQVHGEELDGRADIFSLGIVLWELLTGKKLFSTTGKSEYTVLKMIENCDKIIKPPSVINSQISPELDEIVMKSLTKKRNERYQTAAEFQRALQRYLVINFPDHNISELPYWMDRLFGEDKALDQKQVMELNNTAEDMIGNDGPELMETEQKSQKGPEATGGSVSSAIFDSPPSVASAPTGAKRTSKSPAKDKSTGTLGKVLEKDIRVGDVNQFKNEKGPSFSKRSESRELELDALGGHQLEYDLPLTQARRQKLNTDPFVDRTRRSSTKVFALAAVAAIIALVLYPDLLKSIPYVSTAVQGGKILLTEIETGKRYVPMLSEYLRANARKETAATVALAKATPTPTQAPEVATSSHSVFVNLRVTPAGLGTTITLNGHTMQGPVPVIELPFDTAIDMKVERKGFKPFQRQFYFSESLFAKSREVPVEAILEPENFGYLSVKGNLSGEVYVREMDPVTKTVNQSSSTWYFRSRFDQQKFPPGTYMVQLTNRALEMEASETVRVEKGLISRMTLELETTRASDLLNVSPDKILGMLGWFRAGSITGVRERDVIESWNDMSKNLNQSMQKNPVKRPAFYGSAGNGQAILSFDGVDDGFESELLASRMRGLKTLTAVYVVRLRENRPQTVLGCYNADRNKSIVEFGFDGESRIAVREDSMLLSSPNRALASEIGSRSSGFAIYSTVVTPTSVMVHENGAKRINADGGEVDFSKTAICTIGQSFEGARANHFLSGDVAEILVYDHALSVREQDSIERYLSQLYRIPLSSSDR